MIEGDLWEPNGKVFFSGNALHVYPVYANVLVHCYRDSQEKPDDFHYGSFLTGF